MSNRSSNTTAVPEAKSAMDRFKFEVANELGVPLTNGYNGNLTSRQNGSVGGNMVRKMIEAQERQMSGAGAAMQSAGTGAGTGTGTGSTTGMGTPSQSVGTGTAGQM